MTIERAIEIFDPDNPMQVAGTEFMEAAYFVRDLLIGIRPVEPQKGGNQGVDGCWWYICPMCQKAIDYKDEYCRHCGRGLRWDAADRC